MIHAPLLSGTDGNNSLWTFSMNITTPVSSNPERCNDKIWFTCQVLGFNLNSDLLQCLLHNMVGSS